LRGIFYNMSVVLIGVALGSSTLTAQSSKLEEPRLPIQKLARENFGNDAPWFLRNIPFLEIDDPGIQQIYYYRWKLYRAHIREIGLQGTSVLEFLPKCSLGTTALYRPERFSIVPHFGRSLVAQPPCSG
jgi:hypothetical protein